MDDDLEAMSRAELIEQVKTLRVGIRQHRDTSGHDLCWYHPQLWSLLPEPLAPAIAVPPWDKFMRGCIAFRTSLDAQAAKAPIHDREFE